MIRVAPRGDGTTGVQVIDDVYGTVKEVENGEGDAALLGLKFGYYSDDGVFVRSLDDEPVAFKEGGQRAHSAVESR